MEELLSQATRYTNRCDIFSRAHFFASNDAQNKGRVLGIPVVILTTIIGTSIFASIGQNPDTELKVIAGVIAVAAAIASALHNFMNFAEITQKHRTAGAKWAELRREFELFTLKYSRDRELWDEAYDRLKDLIARIAQADNDSPNIPDKSYNRAKRAIQGVVKEDE